MFRWIALQRNGSSSALRANGRTTGTAATACKVGGATPGISVTAVDFSTNRLPMTDCAGTSHARRASCVEGEAIMRKGLLVSLAVWLIGGGTAWSQVPYPPGMPYGVPGYGGGPAPPPPIVQTYGPLTPGFPTT